MVTSSSSLSWFGSTTPTNAATLRSQVIKPATSNGPVMSSNLELGVPTNNSSLMAFVQPSAKCNQSIEKPRQAGVGHRLNLMG
jgi:hypothetical protein